MKKKRRLLVPAALAVAAGSSCGSAQPVCNPAERQDCLPDGGRVCPSGCGSFKESDGGIICLC
jgi:hypothetical protein